uniref:EGF-like domain-containing protein n=1 Tax=Panagrellus redivivus TaxID=6233 RepID=A0A7E4WA30_PANRE
MIDESSHNSKLAIMSSDAIPSYEMVLKSNEVSTDEQIVRLSENETATISCRINDTGFKEGTLKFSKNGKPISSKGSNGLTYNVENYNSSGGPITFICASTRLDGTSQTRKLKVTSRLSRKITKDDKLCAVNKCINDGVCVQGNADQTLDTTEYCICPQNMRGNRCEYFDGNKRTKSNANPNYLYASIGILFIAAVIFAVLFGREKKKRTVTKRQLTQVRRESRKQRLPDEPYPLDGYVICDGREEEELSPNVVTVVNEYDNVPRIDERAPFKNKTIIKNPAKYTDSIGITEEIARSNRLFESNPPLPVLANSHLPPPPSSRTNR